LRTWLYEHAGRTGRELAASGKDIVSESNARATSGTDGDDEFHRIIAQPHVQNLFIAVSGAPNAGISMVCKVMGSWSGTAVPIEAMTRGSASPCSPRN
jgi:hypothetical protein